MTHAYTFDVHLVVAVTVVAASEAEARATYQDAIPSELLLPNGDRPAIVMTISLDDSTHDPLVHIDGEAPQQELQL